jgi:hypothetical protein
VREAFLGMMIEWMTGLSDRWDHEMRLLPYLLNGLTDRCPPGAGRVKYSRGAVPPGAQGDALRGGAGRASRARAC